MWHGPCPQGSQPRCVLRQVQWGRGGGRWSQDRAGHLTPFTGVTQADFQEEGQPGRTSRSGPSKGLRGALTEDFKTMARALANVTGNCLCSQLPREPAFPSCPGGQGGREARERFQSMFVQQPLPGASRPRMAFSALCLGCILPSLFSMGHILSLWGNAPGTLRPLPPRTPLLPPFASSGTQGGPCGLQGARGQSTGTGWHATAKSHGDELDRR